jgi:endonuclease/exonuclease/phosphatase family metal-dependent hydrolase
MAVALSGISLGGCSFSQAKEAEPVVVKVMTFNLRTSLAKDNHPWSKRWAVVKQMVEQEKPDVIGTQEGTSSQLSELKVGLPSYQWIGEGREGGKYGEFVAIFYREDRLKPLQQGNFWLSETPDKPGSQSWGSAYPRMATWILFEDLANQKQFYVLNTHLDDKSETAREKGAELIARTVNAWDPKIPVIITGDFNSYIQESAGRVLTTQGQMKDAFREAAEKINDHLGTFHHYINVQTGGGIQKRIDYIFFRGNISVKKSEIVTFHINGQYPSDHFPVTADIVLH